MDPKRLIELIDNNVGKLKYLIGNRTKFLADPQRSNQARYLYPSVVNNLTQIACHIQDRENWRPPINPADIFILMADNEIIHHHIVPDLKRAIRLSTRVAKIPKEELFEELKAVIRAITMCNDAFKVYFQLKELDKLG
ncbi:hypothetical protein DRP53_10170 [candidate division WOR-3 bacterium]|uniref:DUF86 domain-containing protein n=1 Tax=candidate division WOR-3 bacterium TaxID=2052148 RepID=A0A660SD57_UNCW3|nr:MAG: hypothetical protein DRP53_10170 [candidate division WOR-3 bacterium]